MFKYLSFFGKSGEYLNFEYDSDNDIWNGRIDYDTLSEGLIEDYQIYVMEQVWNPNPGIIEYSWPRSITIGGGIKGFFDPREEGKPFDDYEDGSFPVPQHFIYDPIGVPATAGMNTIPEPLVEASYTINKFYQTNIALGYTGVADTILGATTNYPGMVNCQDAYNRAVQINLAYQPNREDAFNTYLYLQTIGGTAFAKIQIYGEGLGEDERLKVMLENIGQDLLPQDTKIFDTSDINEPQPDWALINRKRKELLIEHQNIFPFLGSYRALINIIKFFGYQNLRVKEYWKNVDLNSKNFGKLRQTNIIDLFTPGANFNDTRTVPSKIYKKTNQFGLFYDITEATNEFDNDGLPIVKESFQFTLQEVLIKLFALKKKLETYYLPLNARIIDIVGEAIFFAKYDINTWNDQSRIESISLGINPKISVLPSKKGFIEDLRPMFYYGTAVGPDLTVGGTSLYYSWLIGVGNTADTSGPLSSIQTYYLDFYPGGGTTFYRTATTVKTDDDDARYLYPNYMIVDKMIDSWKGATESIFKDYNVYQEGGTSGRIRIVSLKEGVTGQIVAGWYSNTTSSIPSGTFTVPSPTGGTATYINISPNGSFGATGASIGYYGEAFLGYFGNKNFDVKKLNDAEGIPVGYPIVLQNDTFDLTWADAEVSYNQLDFFSPTGPTNGLGQTLYSIFDNSFTVTGWTSVSGGPTGTYPIGATYISIPATAGVTGFPYGSYPITSAYAWYNIGERGFIELEWKVEKLPDAGPTYSHTSSRLNVKDGYRYPLILPYPGEYRIQLRMWDLWNNVSIRVNDDFINVKPSGPSDFIGWYKELQRTYTWQDSNKRYPTQSDYSEFSREWKESHKPTLRWKDYNSTWNLPFHPNDEIGIFNMSFNALDTIEFYESQVNENTNPLVDRFPYNWNLVGDLMNWFDGYHLWWDGMGPKFSQTIIDTLGSPSGVTGSTSYLYVSKGNSTLNIDSPLTKIYWTDGPTGFTGATGASAAPSGGTGSIIYSATNGRVYVWNGSDWKYTNEELDGIAIPNVTTGSTAPYIQAVKKMNLIGETNPHSLFDELMCYYTPIYDNTFNITPKITIATKDYSYKEQYKFNLGFDYAFAGGTMYGGTAYRGTFETPFFGNGGDIPAAFEIYSIGPSASTILIGPTTNTGMTSAYTIGSTNLIDLANELNSASNLNYPGLMEYTYNIVYSAPGWTGGSGPTAYVPQKIQAIAKAFTSPFYAEIDYTGDIIGTIYGRPSIQNVNWDEIRVLKYSEVLPRMILINFTYDNSLMKGKTNPRWTISREGTPTTENIYYDNPYMSYLFKDSGDYTITLELEDTNGNKSKTIKKQIIKIE